MSIQGFNTIGRAALDIEVVHGWSIRLRIKEAASRGPGRYITLTTVGSAQAIEALARADVVRHRKPRQRGRA